MKTALITGASFGLGFEFADIFAKEKYNLVIVARTPICSIKSQEYCGYMEKYGVPEIIRLYENFSGERKQK